MEMNLEEPIFLIDVNRFRSARLLSLKFFSFHNPSEPRIQT